MYFTWCPASREALCVYVCTCLCETSRCYLIYRFTGFCRAIAVEISEYRLHVPTGEREGASITNLWCGVCVFVPGTALAWVTLALRSVIWAIGADVTEERSLMQLLEWSQLTHCTWSHYCRERERERFCARSDAIRDTETMWDRKCRSVTQVEVIRDGGLRERHWKRQFSMHF